MSFMSGIEDEFVFGDLKVYREFDISHFISNARSALTNKIETVKFNNKLNHYSTTLEKAIKCFSDIVVDTESMKTFLNSYNRIDRQFTMRDVESLDVITIKPQYIGQYTTMVGNMIDDILKGKIDVTAASEFITGEYVGKVQRQVVKTSLPFGKPSKELIKIKSNKYVEADLSYIKQKVCPFVSKYNEIKQNTYVEANAVYNAIREAELTVTGMLNTINKIKVNDSYPSSVINTLNQVSYNAIRGLIDIVSYTTYMTIRKLNILSSNIISCNNLYMDIMNITSGVTESSTFDSIMPTDTSSLADEFMAGQTGAFDDLAKKIYDFHMNIPGINSSLDVIEPQNDPRKLNVELGQNEFNPTIYKEVFKIFDSVDGGLDTIAAASDDYLMVFDDIIKEAGFELRIEDRYRTYLDSIDDITEYRSVKNVASTGEINKILVSRLLTEIKEFPTLMNTISERCMETKMKIDMLINRFSNNINGEFKDAETINEIKIFLGSLLEQYKTTVNIICGKFMHRLKEMGMILSSLEASDTTQSIVPSTFPIETSSSLDISEGVMYDLFDAYEAETLAIINALEKDYYAEKIKHDYGMHVTFEAPNPASPTATPPQQPSNANATGQRDAGNTSVTVTETNQQSTNKPAQTPAPTTTAQPVQNTKPQPAPTTNASTPVGASPAPSKPSEKYNSMADKFAKLVNKKAGNGGNKLVDNSTTNQPVSPATESAELFTEGNMKFMKQNIDELTSRSYSNVNVRRIPTGNRTDENAIEDLKKIASNIEMLANNPGELQNIKTEADVIAKVMPMIPNLKPEEDIKKQAKNYFKTGSTADPQPVDIANSDLKNQVVNELIPRVEKFYSVNSQALADAAKEVGDALDKLHGVCNGTNEQQAQPQPVTASADFGSIYGYSLFNEADNSARPTEIPGNPNANTTTSLKSVFSMVSKVVNAVVSGALNSRYEVNNDDIKEANALVPKAKVAQVKTQAEKDAEKEKENSNNVAVTQIQGNEQQAQPQPVAASADTITDGSDIFEAESYLNNLINELGL